MKIIFSAPAFAILLFLFTSNAMPLSYVMENDSFTEFIYVDGNRIKLKDGIDLSGKDLSGVRINQENKLSNVSFDRSNFTCANLGETVFVRCSFRDAIFDGTESHGIFVDCDFTGTILSGGSNYRIGKTIISLNNDDLRETYNLRGYIKNLRYVMITSDFEGMDFSGFDLRNSRFYGSFKGANLSDAWIEGCVFKYYPLSKEQLSSTKDFRAGVMIDIGVKCHDFEGMDLSKFHCQSCHFSDNNFENVKLIDTVITNCNFERTENLTLAQIKSTWNYKAGRMEGVKLPKELQAQLDAEKKKKGSEKRDREQNPLTMR